MKNQILSMTLSHRKNLNNYVGRNWFLVFIILISSMKLILDQFFRQVICLALGRFFDVGQIISRFTLYRAIFVTQPDIRLNSNVLLPLTAIKNGHLSDRCSSETE